MMGPLWELGRQVAAMLMLSAAAQSGPCPVAPAAGVVHAYVNPQRASARDSLVTVTVCLAGSESTGRIGSYHGELLYDRNTATLVRLNPVTGGARADNAQSDRISFAGANPTGFTSPVVLSAVFMMRTRAAPSLKLRILEANGVNGSDLSKLVAFVPNPRAPHEACTAPAAKRAPVIEDLVPDSVANSTVLSGEPIVIEVRGCGFDATNNTVYFGPYPVSGVPSSEGGTRLQFAVPQYQATGGEVSPRPIQSGTFAVSVTTRNGKSNIASFVIH